MTEEKLNKAKSLEARIRICRDRFERACCDKANNDYQEAMRKVWPDISLALKQTIVLLVETEAKANLEKLEKEFEEL